MAKWFTFIGLPLLALYAIGINNKLFINYQSMFEFTGQLGLVLTLIAIVMFIIDYYIDIFFDPLS